MNNSQQTPPTVKSAERVISLLGVLAVYPLGLTFTDLKEKSGIPKSSLFQLLNTLDESRMIQFDSNSKKYYLGFRFWELASAFSNNLPVAQIAEPFLNKLSKEVNETIQMAVLDKTDVVYISKKASSQPVQLVSQVGTRLPAYVTGIGKAILACLSEEEILDLYPTVKLQVYTNNTIGSRNELLEELRLTRKRGYSRDLGEYSLGIHCIAAPVLGFNNLPVAAISISMLEGQITEEKEELLAQALVKCTNELSIRLGAVNSVGWKEL